MLGNLPKGERMSGDDHFIRPDNDELKADLSFEQVRAAYNAIMEEGQKRGLIVWGPMVSMHDINNFIKAAHRAIVCRS